MKTKIFTLNEKGQLNNINQVVEILKNGGLVAIPTETVYGLAVDGLNGQAVRKIFKAKERPMDNPLILHISEIDQVYELVKEFKDNHRAILEKIWPGPLTVVMKKSSIVPDEISAGLETVAIRMPDVDVTRDIIRLVGRPLAAPSANISTRPSPTRAQDVLRDLEGRIDAVVDGGESNIGIESTVLDLTSDHPKILRPGYYTQEMLEEYFGKVTIDLALKSAKETPKSPGQKYKHYAPRAEVLVLLGDDEAFDREVNRIINNSDKLIGLMAFEEDIEKFDLENRINMGPKDDLSTMAKKIFASFRNLDDNGVELIIVRGVEEEGFGLSIMNRLIKAASNNVRRI